jgi:hypothetical protein
MTSWSFTSCVVVFSIQSLRRSVSRAASRATAAWSGPGDATLCTGGTSSVGGAAGVGFLRPRGEVAS